MDDPTPRRAPMRWLLAAVAVLLVAALLLTALAGRSFFGPSVPTPEASAAELG